MPAEKLFRTKVATAAKLCAMFAPDENISVRVGRVSCDFYVLCTETAKEQHTQASNQIALREQSTHRDRHV